MPKLKKTPNTKQQSKFLGPYTVTRITDSHVVIPNPKSGTGVKKDKKIPIDIILPFHERELEIGQDTRKKKSENTFNTLNKKPQKVNICKCQNVT